MLIIPVFKDNCNDLGRFYSIIYALTHGGYQSVRAVVLIAIFEYSYSFLV